MKFTKLKNKLNAIKGEIKRNTAVSYSEWLKTEGLDDNVENRQLYGLYVLSIDESNKKADMRLSQIIGRGVFVAVFLVIFIIMCCNSASATGLYWQNNFDDFYEFETEGPPHTSDILLYVPYNYGDYSYGIIYGRTYNFATNDYSTLSISITDTEPFIAEYHTYLGTGQTSFVQYLYAKYGDDLGVTDYLYDININLFDMGCYQCFLQHENTYNNAYSEGYDEGNADGYDDGYDDGYYYGENTGFQTGYDDGYNVGVSNGYNQGVMDGYDDGYDVGYTNGINDGEIAKKSIFAIFDAPIKVLTSLLDFEIFGINLLAIFKVILTILLLGAIAKFVLSIAL